MKSAMEIMARIKSSLTENPALWAEVLVIGWWKMLESSGMPAPIDDVLGAKFSPSDWPITATRASGNLAMRIASRSGRTVSIEDGLDYLCKTVSWAGEPLLSPPEIEGADLGRVIRVLQWEVIEASVPINVQKALGLAWFCQTAWSLTALIPVNPEPCVKLSAALYDTLNEVTQFNEDTIDEVVDGLAHRGVNWASDLLTLPELV